MERTYTLEQFGYTKAGFKAKADRCYYFGDNENNPERQVAQDLLYRRGGWYTLDEVKTLIEHLGVSTSQEVALMHPDDFPAPVVANAERAERHFMRVMQRIERIENGEGS